MNPKQLGSFGEETAKNYLEKQGYKILATNYSKKWGQKAGEIDIIAKIKNTISFIEIKTGFKSKNFSPEQRVDYSKQKKLKQLVQLYLSEKKIPLDSKWQIDIIAVEIDPETKETRISHFKNAVDCG